jgi:uncharacterized protein (DUF488 family)
LLLNIAADLKYLVVLSANLRYIVAIIGPIIYTIGYGRQPIEKFLALLQTQQIDTIADVRAIARSRWPQFQQKALVVALGSIGINYIHFANLGWKIQAPPADFERGIAELVARASQQQVGIMCAESLPQKCHRHLILTPRLQAAGITVRHILPDGQVQLAADTQTTVNTKSVVQRKKSYLVS